MELWPLSKVWFKKGVKTDGGHIEVHLNVHKGIITELDIFGDFFVNRDIDIVKQALVGVEHRKESVLAKLKEIKSSEYFNNISEEELAESFF
jgi:lipoate-protein ligase A